MILGLLTLLLACLALLWAAMVVFTVWTLSHPPRRGYAFALARNLPSDPAGALGRVQRDTQPPCTSITQADPRTGLVVHAWDIPGELASADAVIITHGWGDSRVVMLNRLPTFAALASRVIMWDMPGHGDSPGLCALGTNEVDRLLSLVDHLGLERVVLYGFSLGAGVSIAAGARLGDRCPLVIAEAPYRTPITPARNMLALRGLPHKFIIAPAMVLLGLWHKRGTSWATSQRTGPAGGFDRALHAAKLHSATRLIVIHGERDAICPLADAQDIASAGRGRLVQINDGNHTDLWVRPATRELVEGTVAAAMLELNASAPALSHEQPLPRITA